MAHVRTDIPSQKRRKRYFLPFYEEERAGTQPARHTFYDADRADEAKNEVKSHKIASYTTFSGGTPHDDAERAGTLMNGENSSRSEVCSMMW